MTSELPVYLTLKLKTTLERVTEAARAKGLEALFAYELFDLEHQVAEASARQDPDLAKKALTQEARLLNRIESLPGKLASGVSRTPPNASRRG